MLKAGTAIRNISPEKPMFLVGYPHVERTSEGIHDPLLASALCIDNGESKLVMVALDILMISPLFARELSSEIGKRLSIPDSNVFISCTHTHSGPVTVDYVAWGNDPLVPKTDPKYLAFLKSRIIEAVMEADSRMEACSIAVSSANIDGVGTNRLSPEAVRDPEAGILAFRRKNGDIFALNLIYSMHPTVIHEDIKLVNSDFPYYTRLHLRENIAEDLVVLYHNGPCGNLSPRYHVKAQTFEESERLGRRLGEQVLSAVRELKDADFTDTPVLKALAGDVELPPREIPSLSEAEKVLNERVAHFKKLRDSNAPHGPVRTAECAVFGAEETVEMARVAHSGKLAELVNQYRNARISVLRIGDVCIAGMPGELFVEYSLEIKKRAALRTFVVCLVNGELQGYIVTPEAAESGGYEASNALFAPESGKLMVDAVLDMIEKI